MRQLRRLRRRNHWTTGERAHFAALMHLTATQKATAVAKSTLMFERGRPEIGTGAKFTEELAEKAGVAVRTVTDAKKVLRKGTDEEKTALESGKSKAKTLAKKIRAREKQSSNGESVDDMGYPVPEAALAYWNRKPEARNVLNQIGAARCQVRKLVPDDPMWSAVNLNGVLADLSAAYNPFYGGYSGARMPVCKGK